jgi:threonine/homoserine/homoserine lactone efflux protein
MTLEAIMTFAIAVAALAIKPGAGMMMVMSRTVSQGIGACLTFVLGFCIVSIIFLGLVIYGYKFVDVDLVFISIIIKSFAAVYLIWLGVKGLQNAKDQFHVSNVKIESFFDNLTASLILTASNPLTIIFYAGILPTILNIKEVGFNDFTILSFTIIVVEYTVAIGYALPFVLFRKAIPPNFMQALTYFSSIIIILVGLYIGYSALPSKDLTAVF